MNIDDVKQQLQDTKEIKIDDFRLEIRFIQNSLKDAESGKLDGINDLFIAHERELENFLSQSFYK